MINTLYLFFLVAKFYVSSSPCSRGVLGRLIPERAPSFRAGPPNETHPPHSSSGWVPSSAFSSPSPARRQPKVGDWICSTSFAPRLKFFIHMASQRVLQYVAGAKQKPPTVYLRCHVKPGASKVREGITALTDSTIELCVAAVPKDGESNKAVLAVLSEVSEPFRAQPDSPLVLSTLRPRPLVVIVQVSSVVLLARSRKADTGLRHSTSQSQTCKSPEVPSLGTRSSLLLAGPSRTVRQSVSAGF